MRRRFLIPLVLLVGAVLWLGLAGGESPSEEPLSRPAPYRFASPEVGINVHLWWDRWAAQRDWRLVSEGGFIWAKQRVAWRDVRPYQDLPYDWTTTDAIVEEAEVWDVALVFRLDNPPAWAETDDLPPFDPEAFGLFCGDVAARYAGRVRGYQVWNEPNLAREWGGRVPDPEGYVTLLKACATAIRRADPAALIITAGLAPTGSGPPVALPDLDFLAGMYESEAAPHFDLLGLHAPGYAAPPEVSPEEAASTPAYGGQRFFCFRHIEEAREVMVAYGDGDKQVAVLEFGWTTDPIHADYAWFAVSPEEQADYLVRAVNYAQEHWSPWVGPMFVWNLPDPFWTPENEEFWWSIADPFHWEGGEVRKAYEVLVEMGR